MNGSIRRKPPLTCLHRRHRSMIMRSVILVFETYFWLGCSTRPAHVIPAALLGEGSATHICLLRLPLRDPCTRLSTAWPSKHLLRPHIFPVARHPRGYTPRSLGFTVRQVSTADGQPRRLKDKVPGRPLELSTKSAASQRRSRPRFWPRPDR